MNSEIMGGKPVNRGTRITVELVLRKLGAGTAAQDILADHPTLRGEDIRAAQAFAADYLADEELVYRLSLIMCWERGSPEPLMG